MIELVCGPMSSGKTTEMLRRIKRAQIAQIPTILLKPSTDDRAEGAVTTPDAQKVLCITIPGTERNLKGVIGNARVVGIDEIQFFKDSIIQQIRELSDSGIRFVIAGLDLDFNADPFPVTMQLMAVAERVQKLSAVCVNCGSDAPRSYRKVRAQQTVLVGGLDTYEARCVPCWHGARVKP